MSRKQQHKSQPADDNLEEVEKKKYKRRVVKIEKIVF